MKKNIIKYSFAILLMTLATSCDNFLDREPESQVSDKTFWQNEEDANSAILGCYSQLRYTLNDALSYYAYGDIPTDIYTSERDLSDNFNYVNELNWGVGVAIADTWHEMYKLRTFENYYTTIRQVNLCIYNIPSIPKDEYADYETTFNQYMGEAYFVRALCYFFMARIWGDVPIIDDNIIEQIDLSDYPRDSEFMVLAKAQSDCETALSYLDWEYVNADDRAVRANAGAAWALLAHIYAWKGDYASCEIATKKILDSGFYSYVNRESYLDIFSGQSQESIFEIAQNTNTEAQAATSSIAGKVMRDDYLTTQTETTIWPLDTLTLRQTLFNDSTDLRRQNGFWQFSSDYPVVLKYSNITYSSSDFALSMNNILIWRLAGIALLQAEAQASQGKDAEARATLNNIRALAGLGESSATHDDLFEAIIDERGRELFLEGHRFFDLVRLAKEKEIYKFGSTMGVAKISESEFKAGKYKWPIQPSVIELNPLLVQTEFWKSEME